MDILSIKQRFGIVGNNPHLNSAIEVALRVAATDLTVLVCGESGVGKEFFPQIVHTNSARKHNNYIAVNCGAIPEGTIDSELFGHEKGAFTGATDSRKGYFEIADGGTIFLDEVAELPLTTQVRLLRVLQSGEFIKVGSSKIQKSNVRVVAATNVKLNEAVAKGAFREDLYYRLSTVPITVPSLRDRKDDISILFRRFSVDVANKYSMPPIKLDEEAKLLLENYRWPGNIRQLKNVAEQISVIEPSRDVTIDILRKYLPNISASSSPVVFDGGAGVSGDFSSEREILYKFLFDMKNDIRELKDMVRELSGKGVSHVQEPMLPNLRSDTNQLALPESFAVSAISENERFDVAELVDDSDLSDKERFQRDAIIKSLKKHNGKRKEAASELFISERTLYRRIKELGIEE